jgi:hypothetical protein
MKNLKISFILFAVSAIAALNIVSAETLFQVKDSSDRVVLDVSSDGLRVLNEGDTVMVISSSEIKAVIDNSKALSRSFTVATSTSAKGQANVLEVTPGATTMREGNAGVRYTDFTPENIFIGLNAGTRTLPNGTWRGMSNIFLGNHSGYWNDWGSNNIFIGDSTGFNSKNTDKNIFIGNLAGYNTESDDPNYGSGNVFVGVSSGYSNLEGHDNVYLGKQSGEDNVNGSGNVFVGSWAGNSNTSSDNTILGGAALYKNTSGNKNTALGAYAGNNNLTGLGNVFLGYKAGYNETGSNKLYIDNSDTSFPLIWGDFSTDELRFNGNVGIGITPNSTYGVNVDESIVGGHFQGRSTGTYSRGVRGYAIGGTSTNYGVYGFASGTGATNYAGYFSGDINVTGTVVKSSDEVKIDHPFDPENKTLSHSTVSSDQMSNIYHGNVQLDNEGKATVRIEAWIESVNKDFRYQLTSIGAPGPNLYISREISGNSFGIAGGVPNSKVSWQVTGIRNDNYAKANQILNENEKKDYEKGYYLHPKAYGLTEEAGIEYNIEKNRNKTELK